jgi:hypothetical protein
MNPDEPATPPTTHRGRPLTPDVELSIRERAFLDQYETDFNATRAAIAVGYAGSGVKVTAHKVLARPHVQAELQRRMAARSERLGLTADRCLKDIEVAANLDLGLLFDAHGNLLPVHLMPAHVRRCLVSIEVVKKNITVGDHTMDTTYKVRVIDKKGMHELLAKATGLTREGDGQPVADVPAFALPPDTRGVSVH